MQRVKARDLLHSPDFRERMKDLVLALALIALGVFGYVNIRSGVATGLLEQQDITFATLPSIWSALLVLLAAIYALSVLVDLARVRSRIVREHRAGEFEPAAPRLERRLVLRLVATVVALVLFALLLGELPFFVLVTVFLFATLVTYGQPIHWTTALLAVLGGAGFHALFVWILKLPL